MDGFQDESPRSRGTAPEGHIESYTKQRKPVVRHARSATRILRGWFAAHSTSPYPNELEKSSLSEQTGMSVRQISSWFTNARRRSREKICRAPSAGSSASSLPISFQSQNNPRYEMSPLERWRHSPPEEEAASIFAISNAIENTSVQFGSSLPTSLYGLQVESNSLSSGNASFSGFDSSSSAYSHSSGAFSNFSGDSKRSRKRRRWKRPNVTHDPQDSSQRDGRIFQCTFCTDTFKSRYDWTRHEATLHLILERWSCLPSGPRYRRQEESFLRCALCDFSEPSDEHINTHRAPECMNKPLGDRIFYRRDHLRQHLRHIHKIDTLLPSMVSWKSKTNKLNSRCGFCGETFSLWSDRNDHLTDHFKSGARMQDWKGCRGLDPAVALLVQNAIPPYLIGTESNEIEPFSASKGPRPLSTSVFPSETTPTPFAALTASLGEFIYTAKTGGTIITDELLRREARIIVYGDDDPWNHTPADNDQWLAMFKTGYGLMPTTNNVESPGTARHMGTGTHEASEIGICIPLDLNETPFTLERMQSAIDSDPWLASFNFGSAEIGIGSDPIVPWAWQTPECLAEFSQMGPLAAPNSCHNVCQTQDVTGLDVTETGPGIQMQSACAVTGGATLLSSGHPPQGFTASMDLCDIFDITSQVSAYDSLAGDRKHDNCN